MNINEMAIVHDMPDIEHHFRVVAGPGAGKTRWLVEHIARVLRKSKRLKKTRKIACITYTNIAAEELKKRLNFDLSHVDVSTIHSFLYRNIVKPFSFLIKNDNDGNMLVNIDELTGHVEHIPRWDRVSSWISEIERLNQKRYGYFKSDDNKKKIYKKFPSMDYELNNGTCKIIFRNRYVDLMVPTKNGELLLYKKKYWKYGILHHEDVLYFSHYIISNYPEVLDFIRNKFPYIFIDEFQDTTQLQTWIISKIAERDKNTVVGVIGDLAQSIYLFTGAQRKDFENFSLSGLVDYKKEENYRSSTEIISFLNELRDDITQRETSKTITNYPVTLLIGRTENALKWVKEQDLSEPVVLTRKNETVNLLKNRIEITVAKDDLIKELYAADSDKKRPAFIHSLLIARDYLIKGENKSAVKEVIKYLKKDKSGKKVKYTSLLLRKLSIQILDEVTRDDFLDSNLFDYYDKLSRILLTKHKIKIGAKYGRGKATEFAKKYNFRHLIPFVKTETKLDEKIRTIHSSKGTEFDSVMLVLEENDFRKWIVNCKEALQNDTDDGARINYVALSRAKNFLFINIPDSDKYEFKYKNLEVIKLS